MVISTNSMANRSTLELMLDKIQKLDDDQTKDVLPSLPVRPLSRARLPPRVRKPLALDFDQKIIINSEENDVVQCCLKGICEEINKADSNGVASSASTNHSTEFGIFMKGIEVLKKSESEKGISNIQKCYRGHQVRSYFKDLKKGVITLQSFARGQNTRRDYECRIKRLRAILIIQKHTRKYVERRLQHRHCNKTIHEPNITEDTKDYTQVTNSHIMNLQKQVLRTEAKVREKKEENIALKIQIEEMDKKWRKSEERMKSMEKTWQDQLTYIQKCLAASKKKPGPIIAIEQFDSTQEQNNQNLDSSVVITESGFEQVSRNKLYPEEEFVKLKVRFKAWKKEYRIKLKEAQSTFRKIGQYSETTAKSQRTWWGRFSH